jgi:uncharacterized protein with NRDE domain
MCTLIVATRVYRELPLLVAANRDERLDRPAEPPRVLRPPEVPIALLAPRDVTAGGTWIGLSGSGVFAGVTNRFGEAPDPSRRSRGELVLRALAEPDARSAAHRIAALEPERYNPYHLVIADRVSAHLLVSTGAMVSLVELAPGLHVATERSFNTGVTEREKLIRSRMGSELDRDAPPEDATLEALLSMKADPPFEGTLLHVPEFNYGTRSSSIVRLKSDGGAEFLHAEVWPNRSPWVRCELP